MKENKLEINEIPNHLCCSITGELMQDPVLVAGSGHTYEREAITKWFCNHNTDPYTNLVLTDEGKKLIPNHAVKQSIVEYQNKKEKLDLAQPKIDQEDNDYIINLSQACADANLDLATYLLKQNNAAKEFVSKNGFALLRIACIKENSEIVELLLGYGAIIDPTLALEGIDEKFHNIWELIEITIKNGQQEIFSLIKQTINGFSVPAPILRMPISEVTRMLGLYFQTYALIPQHRRPDRALEFRRTQLRNLVLHNGPVEIRIAFITAHSLIHWTDRNESEKNQLGFEVGKLFARDLDPDFVQAKTLLSSWVEFEIISSKEAELFWCDFSGKKAEFFVEEELRNANVAVLSNPVQPPSMESSVERARSRRSIGLFALAPAPFNDKPDHVIKIGILGSAASGGGLIIHRYLGGEFHDSFDKSYYNAGGVKKAVVIDGKKIDLRIFRDPYGQDPRGGRECRLFPRGIYDCIIAIADLTDSTTLSASTILLLTALREEDFDKKPLIFVGTKNDCADHVKWDLDSSCLLEIPFDHRITCSAKQNVNISELFELAIRKRIELLENPMPIVERNKKVLENISEKSDSKCLIQ